MEAYKLEILDPKALKLIKGIQDLNLIRVTKEPVSSVQLYLNKIRKNASNAPSLDEITSIVEKVRSKRFTNK